MDPHAAHLLIVAGVLPLWVLAGLADWGCHRASRIEATSGLRENGFHWLMFAQMGGAVVLLLVAQPTGLVLGMAFALWLAHQVTVWYELRDAVRQRDVRPLEQMVHSLLELLPLAGLALLAVAHWDSLADASLRMRTPPLHPALIAGVLGASLLFNAIPLAEETLRCMRTRRQ